MKPEERLEIKKGETILQLGLNRSAKGLIISCKAHPTIEEFFRSFGGELQQVSAHGRYWAPVNNPLPPVYAIGDRGILKPLPFEGGHYSLMSVGGPISGADVEITNISFLRLQGISEGSGVTFAVKGVFTREAVRALRDQLNGAIRRFYLDFLKPMDITLTLSTTEN